MSRPKPRYIVGDRDATGTTGLDAALGNIPGVDPLNKFGAATSGIQTSATDIWDRADATPTQQIWLAPTQARVHNLASTSANDDGDPAGTGTNTLRVYGLTSWTDEDETSEDLTMNGVTNVATTNSYVIIHRMKCLTWGSAGPNVGVITATAVTDATVTAQINAGWGQTEMAIYGIPSGKTLNITKWRYGMNKTSGVAADAKFFMLYNPIPDLVTTGFITKDVNSVQSTGVNTMELTYDPPKSFTGPGILKIQATSSVNDIDGDSSFDGYVVDD